MFELARRDLTVPAALRPLAEAVRNALGVDAVSVVLGSPTAPTAVAGTGAVAGRGDELQLRTGHGPSIAALTTATWVLTKDLPADRRWPALSAAARRSDDGATARAVAARALDAGHQQVVVTLYRTQPGAWSVHDLAAADLVTDAAGVVLAVLQDRQRSTTLTAQLQQALGSRATIEQAKGIVMAHRGGTPDQAFAFLSGLSSHRNIKLAQLAGDLVARTQHPNGPRPSGPGTPRPRPLDPT
ncbi:ANTAR domain-containing protein [Cellulomonas endophytica]|uniref:ANTAR domain-containing protein n=1 Tax=Cellulomonas endophytica TaxID=2494735 RepID=UPI0013E90A74|nr:ANTAR domain-containing protein [Cellulomonas endophytica]